MIYGYIRVSTRQQLEGYGLEAQRKEILLKYPEAKIYEEQYTGTKLDGRPRKYSDDELLEAVLLLNDFSYREVVELTGISKSTLIRARKMIGL